MTDLTKKEAYLAMFAFLENEYEMSKSDDIGGLLSNISLLPDGKSVDPAAWKDWEDAIKKVKESKIDASLKLKKLG
jgi:hypothetical protein